MSAWYTPDKVLVCGKLAGGDYHAGLLLHAIMFRYPHAKATLPGIEGTWSANLRSEWCKAAGMSLQQLERRLTKLHKKLGLIERAHGAWARAPNVLHIRPTQRAQWGYYTATTYEALDAVLAGDKSGPLWKLWQAWPDQDPKRLGGIAVWYEWLEDRKLITTEDGKHASLKPYALDLLQQILEKHPAIVEGSKGNASVDLWDATVPIVMETFT